VIIANNKNMINGSSALAPQSIPSRDRDIQKHRDLEKSRKEHERINREKSINKKTMVLRNILVLFILGILLVYRFSVIYNMERNILDVKKQISNINAENESLKIDLLQYNNIHLLEAEALENLNMIPKSRENAIYINLDKSNFKNNLQEGEKESDSLFFKIKKILY
jgi:cell division protein FtsL